MWKHASALRAVALDLMLVLMAEGFNPVKDPGQWLAAVRTPFVKLQVELDKYSGSRGNLQGTPATDMKLVLDDASSPDWQSMEAVYAEAQALGQQSTTHFIGALNGMVTSMREEMASVFSKFGSGVDWKTPLLGQPSTDVLTRVLFPEDANKNNGML